MQGMWEKSESEGISYQTQILRMQKMHLKREFKMKKIIKPKISPKYFKTWPLKKESYLQEMLGWIESERRSYQILNFVGLA